MKNYVRGLWGIVGIGLLTIPVAIAAGASDKPVTGDTVIRETQEAVTATKDYTIQQKDAFQRKVQTELDEMQVRITTAPWTSQAYVGGKQERTSRRRSRN